MKNVIFLDVTSCGCYKNRRFGVTYRLHHQGGRNGVLRLLVTANAVPSSLILVSLMMEEIRTSETSIFTKATRRNLGRPHCSHKQQSATVCALVWNPSVPLMREPPLLEPHGVFWDVRPYGSCKNRRFGGT
jgi:hypothetical protein